ncbi:hypothetical protein BD626DRAFT_505533 [Schizophyllum amplum]|uniref:Chromo domain-containing protein n=1 Tax=Schizophyllum amplum TaxID=97359 RepID=A0A550C5N9_9AGAR|nr:hypothetical protein BD626DRAFT_505533 [Auriculariopsis ampla]
MVRQSRHEWSDGNYEVACIVGARYICKRSHWLYRVKWAHPWDADITTSLWKLEKDFKGCGKLLARFWEEIGEDLRMHPFIPGQKILKPRIVGRLHEVRPSYDGYKEKERYSNVSRRSTGMPAMRPSNKSNQKKRKRELGPEAGSDADDENQPPAPSPTKRRHATPIVASSASSSSGSSDSNSDSRDSSPAGTQPEHELMPSDTPIRGPPPAIDGEWQTEGTDSDTDTAESSSRPPSRCASSTGDVSSLTSLDSESDMGNPDSLFTPPPSGPPRTPSPVDRPTEGHDVPATYPRRPIQLVSVEGEYTSANPTRNKVAEQFGLIVTHSRPAQRSPTPGISNGASGWPDHSSVPEGSSFQDGHVFSSGDNDLSDMLTQRDHFGIYDDVGASIPSAEHNEQVDANGHGLANATANEEHTLGACAFAPTSWVAAAGPLPPPPLPLATSFVDAISSLTLVDGVGEDDASSLSDGELGYPDDDDDASEVPVENHAGPIHPQGDEDIHAQDPCMEEVSPRADLAQSEAADSELVLSEAADVDIIEEDYQHRQAIVAAFDACDISTIDACIIDAYDVSTIEEHAAIECDISRSTVDHAPEADLRDAQTPMDIDVERDESQQHAVALVEAPSHPSRQALLRASDGVWRCTISVKLEQFVSVLGAATFTVEAPALDTKFSLDAHFDDHQASLQLDTFRTIDDVCKLIAVCGRVTQRATIVAATAEDEAGVNLLTNFLRSTSHAAVLPFIGSGSQWLGHIVLYASGNRAFEDMFGGRSGRGRGPVRVAILPWGEWATLLGRRPVLPSTEASLSDTDAAPSWDKHPLLAFIIKFLGFGSAFLDLVRKEGRGMRCYVVQPALDATADARLYSTMLRFVLECYGATEVNRVQAARVLFIPSDGRLTIDRLPMKPNVRVLTYEPSKSCQRGTSMKEIFVVGGVLTFTPMALVENLYSCTKRLEEAAIHPLWACYVLPSVLGMALHLSTVSNADPETFLFNPIIEAVINGECTLAAPTPGTSMSSKMPWKLSPIYCSCLTAQDVIVLAMEEFHAAFGDVPEDRWESEAKKLIHPEMTDVRRCCVLAHSRDPVLSDGKEKIEWLVSCRDLVGDGYEF